MATERDKELSLVAHLAELRDRLMVASIAVVITTVFPEQASGVQDQAQAPAYPLL